MAQVSFIIIHSTGLAPFPRLSAPPHSSHTFLPGFRHQCNEVDIYGKKEAGTGEHLNTFNNQINKHNRKAAAPHGRLPQTKHKLKSRPGPLSSSTVVTPPFIPSGAPPWDSRPVSGAGVVHYHSLHRPRSVPTALGPAPLVTRSMSAASIAAEVEGVGGQPVSVQTIRSSLYQIGLHGYRPRRKPLLKMLHKKACKQVC